MTIDQTEAISKQAAKLLEDNDGLNVLKAGTVGYTIAIGAVEQALRLAATSHITPDAAETDGAAVIHPPEFSKYEPSGIEGGMSREDLWDYACLVGWRTGHFASPAIAPEASELPPSFATVKRLDGTDCPVYTAEQVRAVIANLTKKG